MARCASVWWLSGAMNTVGWPGMQMQTDLLRYEHPDLVVLLGDMISGYAWDQNPGWTETRYALLFLIDSLLMPS